MSIVGLKRLLKADDDPVCFHCREALPAEHTHIADLQSRGLLCVCARCHAAVDVEPQRLRVPRRYMLLPPAAITAEEWEGFEIPVGIAFFFYNSALGRMVAQYPSPAGAIESLLPTETWRQLLATNPWARSLTPDVEALLVRRTTDADECYIVPIDACYELAGRIRSHWRGFGGGPDGRAAIDAFFQQLRERCGRTAE